MVRTCINAPEGPVEIELVSDDPDTERPHGPPTDREPARTASPTSRSRRSASEFDAIHDEVFDDLGDRDAQVHPLDDRDAPAARAARARVLLALALQARLGRSGRHALAGQDPREHGDRPQRHARPVGLDERPEHQLVDAGTGTPPRPRRRGSTPTTTSTTRTRTSAARTRTSATRSCGSTRIRSGTRSTCAADLQPAADGAVRVGRRVPRPRLRGDPQGREVQGGGPPASSRAWPARRARRSSRTTSPSRRSQGSSRRADGRACARGGRRRRRPGRAGAGLAADVPRDADGQRDRQHGPQPVVATRSSSAATSPTRRTPSRQEEVEDESRGGCYVRQLLGAANIEGAPLFHVISRQPRLPGRAPPLPGHAEHPLRARSRRA